MYDTTKPYHVQVTRIIRTTWNTTHLTVDERGIFRKPHARGIEWRHTDGIGKKGEEHWRKRTFQAAVLDALRMNRNDFARDQAIPFEICDHIFMPADDHGAVIEIATHLADECRRCDIAVTSGDTAIHEGQKGLEISITMMGIRTRFQSNKYQEGDILIGIGSSGMHSNGFTRVLSVFNDGESLPDSITTPTLDYYHAIDSVDRVYGTHGRTHITGGGFFRIKEQLGANLDAIIHRSHSLMPHPIFWELRRRGIAEEEMYRTFNCGIGFIVGVEERALGLCLNLLRQDHRADVIGEVRRGNGRVQIQSMFSAGDVSY